jgi:lipoprotein NlpD
VAVAAALAIAACTGNDRRPDAPDTYVVRAGDTLYAIARHYGLDYREIARWNGIEPADLIRPGDRLRLRRPRGESADASRAAPPADAPAGRASPDDPAHRPPDWRWPVEGGTVVGLVRQPSGGVGLRIDGSLNQPVLAAADGTVAYTGSGLRGYGQLVIVNHVRGWLTAYGHNAIVQVKEGETVRAGQQIAAMGPGASQQPTLYFEIRLDGEPLDPLTQLPPR